MESETEAAGSDSEEEEEEEEEEEHSDENVTQEDDGEEMEAVTSSVKMLETAETGVTIESCVTSADNAGDAVDSVTPGDDAVDSVTPCDDAVDSVTSGDDADTCRTCVETQWKNSTAILNGEELIELFKAIHTGKKVLEGLTTIGLVGSWLFISCVHPFTKIVDGVQL